MASQVFVQPYPFIYNFYDSITLHGIFSGYGWGHGIVMNCSWINVAVSCEKSPYDMLDKEGLYITVCMYAFIIVHRYQIAPSSHF